MNLSQTSKKSYDVILAALIAALYVVLTYFSSIFGLAFSGIQLRISEVLTILPVFTPAAIPGLTIGCFISNLSSPYGLVDLIFGTAMTFICAVLTRLFRNIKIKEIPFFSFFPPVIVSAIFVATLTTLILPQDIIMYPYWMAFFITLVSQSIVCYGLGVPLFILIRKIGIFKGE